MLGQREHGASRVIGRLLSIQKVNEAVLLHQLPYRAAARSPAAVALSRAGDTLDYATLASHIESLAGAFCGLGLKRGERVGIYLEKRFEAVLAAFAASAAGGAFVPVNPILKPAQVAYILQDCNVRILVTSSERLALLTP